MSSAIFVTAIISPTKLKIQNAIAFVYCVFFLLVTTKVQFNKLSLYNCHRLCYLGAGKRISSQHQADCRTFSWEEVLIISEMDTHCSPPVQRTERPNQSGQRTTITELLENFHRRSLE
jgi:hypothetical protein